jgi:hypothetical protein
VTPADNGAYTVTSQDGCQTVINLTVSSASKTSIGQMAQDTDKVQSNESILAPFQYYIYPNPTSGVLNVGLDAHKNESIDCLLLNALQQVVWKKHFGAGHNDYEPIYLGNLSEGIYYLILQTSRGNVVHPIVLKR